jgi:hypothetical protein
MRSFILMAFGLTVSGCSVGWTQYLVKPDESIASRSNEAEIGVHAKCDSHGGNLRADVVLVNYGQREIAFDTDELVSLTVGGKQIKLIWVNRFRSFRQDSATVAGRYDNPAIAFKGGKVERIRPRQEFRLGQGEAYEGAYQFHDSSWTRQTAVDLAVTVRTRERKELRFPFRCEPPAT